MMKKIDLIPDPTIEEGFEGLYCGNPDIYNDIVLDFDLHAAAKYVRENSIGEITEEVKEMFRK